MAIPGPMGLNSPQDIATALKFGPQTAQALQHSSYLAQALSQLNGEGSQNIHSGAELGAKLLAEALLSRTYDKAQRATMAALQGDQQAQLTAAIRGTPLDTPAAPSPAPQEAPGPAPAPVAPPPAPVEPPQGQPPQQGQQNAPAVAPASYSPQDREALIRMGAGEAGGEGPGGIAAAMHVALNRLRSGYGGARSLYDVVHQPHQFTAIQNGVQPDPRALAVASQVADGVLSGQTPDPTNGAMAFLNPELTQKLYGHIPPWAQGGNGQRIGRHVFFGGAPQVAQNTATAPPGPSPDSQPIDAPPPAPPVDPATIAMGAQPFQPQAAPAPPPQAVAPRGVSAIPHQVVTPDEWKTAFAMAQDWHTRDLGLAEIAKLKMRAASAVPMKEGTYWGSDGKPHAVEQFVDQPGAPNATIQRSNLDNHITATPNPAYGAVAPGMRMGPDGKITPVPVEQGARFRIPGTLGLYQNGPDGKPVKVADDAITPKDLQTARDAFNSNEDVKKANEGIAAYNGLTNTLSRMAGNNGVLSTAAIDSYLRGINPGMGARNTTVKMFLDHLGLPTEVSAWVQSNVPGGGGGYLTPATMNQMLATIRQYAGAHAQIAQGVADRDLKAMNGYGVPVSPEMLGEALTPFNPPPKISWLNDGAPPPPAPPSQASAVAAEIARRKAAGTWKGH